MVKIDSPQNPLIKKVRALLKKRARQEHFLIEGSQAIARYIESGRKPIETFYSDSYSGPKQLLENGRYCSDRVLETISYRNHPSWIVAVAKRESHELETLDDADIVVAIEQAEKPGNIGAILRSACAVGVSAIFILDSSIDIYSPNIIRASLGTIFLEKLIITNNSQAYQWFQKRDIHTVATSPRGNMIYTDVDFQKKSAIIVGSEKDGLSEFWLEKADSSIKIPMSKKVDSLNMAQSATICLYEAARQRNFRGMK